MVAGGRASRDDIFWNHFSTFDDRIVLASSYQLHEFARDTGWPFEAFLVKVIVTQLLVAVRWPTLGFHPNTGCMFDYNEDRSSMKDNAKDPRIDRDCLDSIGSTYRPAAEAFIDLLRSYGPAE